MRKSFLGYYKPSKKDLAEIWKNCTFVFDTSTLLNIYRYTPTTREDFFRLLSKIQDRIWIPYQVGYEYHEQRENVIAQQNVIYSDLDDVKVTLDKILNKYRRGHPFADIGEIKELIYNSIEQAKSILKDAQSKAPDLLEEDTYLLQLSNLFDGKVGLPYTKDELKKLYEQAQQRFSEKIPPGYEDDKNKNYPFGDVILWFQMIDYAKSKGNPILFIIDDAKEDWWRKEKDKKDKILSPRPELMEEIQTKAHIPFYMYLSDEFIRLAPKFLSIQIDPGTVQEVREVRQQLEEREQSQEIDTLIRTGTLKVPTMADVASALDSLFNSYRIIKIIDENKNDVNFMYAFRKLIERGKIRAIDFQNMNRRGIQYNDIKYIADNREIFEEALRTFTMDEISKESNEIKDFEEPKTD